MCGVGLQPSSTSLFLVTEAYRGRDAFIRTKTISPAGSQYDCFGAHQLTPTTLILKCKWKQTVKAIRLRRQWRVNPVGGTLEWLGTVKRLRFVVWTQVGFLLVTKCLK